MPQSMTAIRFMNYPRDIQNDYKTLIEIKKRTGSHEAVRFCYVVKYILNSCANGKKLISRNKNFFQVVK